LHSRRNEVIPIFVHNIYLFIVNEQKTSVNRKNAAKEIERVENIVTRSHPCILLKEEQVIIELPLFPCDVIILCTDGFWQKINVPSVYNLPTEEIQIQVNAQSGVMDDNYSFMRISI